MLTKKKKIQTRSAQPQKSEDTGKLNEAIQKKAYELFEKRGCCHGKEFDDWVEAEKIVKSGHKSN